MPKPNGKYYKPRQNTSKPPKIKKIKHKDVNKRNIKVFEVNAKKLKKQQKKINKAYGKNKKNPMHQGFLKFKHQDLSGHSQPILNVSHKDLNDKRPFGQAKEKKFKKKKKKWMKKMNSACYPSFKIKHKNFSSFCYPKLKMKHKDIQSKCYPTPKIKHQDLSSKCLPKYKVKHKDLSFACYPKLKIKHKDLSDVCYPKFKVKHKNLNNVCYKPSVKLRHRDLNDKCYPKLVIKHKDFEKLNCTTYRIKHVPLSKYKVHCDPNIQDHTTTMERVGKDVKYFFTFKRKFCKLEDRYSGVAAGDVIETSLGDAVVVDYVVKKKIYYPVRLIVALPKATPRKPNGDPRIKEVKLSKTETKEIMIRELIKRGKFKWLVRMYPEERKNLEDLKKLYLGIPGKNVPPPEDLEDIEEDEDLFEDEDRD